MKGNDGQTCNDVCGAFGQVCNSVRQSALTTNEIVANTFLKAGYTCMSFAEASNHDGAPFSTGNAGADCAHVADGYTSTCTENEYSHHAALCYCEAGNKHYLAPTIAFCSNIF